MDNKELTKELIELGRMLTRLETDYRRTIGVTDTLDLSGNGLLGEFKKLAEKLAVIESYIETSKISYIQDQDKIGHAISEQRDRLEKLSNRQALIENSLGDTIKKSQVTGAMKIAQKAWDIFVKLSPFAITFLAWLQMQGVFK